MNRMPDRTPVHVEVKRLAVNVLENDQRFRIEVCVTFLPGLRSEQERQIAVVDVVDLGWPDGVLLVTRYQG